MKRLQVLRSRKLRYQTSTTTAPYLFSNNGNKIKVCGKGDLTNLEISNRDTRDTSISDIELPTGLELCYPSNLLIESRRVLE